MLNPPAGVVVVWEIKVSTASVPDGRFAQVSGAGHVGPLLPAPSEVIQHILAFWSETRNRRAAA
ncbi:hypothetical protein [Pseudarthrobacter sp. NS4]|uniref:hypothetical protein n=1 Tax=Pseudarthrobacter sp. NS4 TaxID=2973976 RepID=UPI002163835B|nr:hypothetical protein [Pseudarthrobacter sp. NS4]